MPRTCQGSNDGWAALGTQIQMWDRSVSPSVWVPMALIDDISGPQGKTQTIDTTTHDATDGNLRYIASFSDSGSVSLTAVWDPTNVTHNQLNFRGLKKAYDDKQTRTWRIVYPTSPHYEIIFCAFVDGYSPMAKAKDALRANVSLKVTGGFDLQLASIDDND